MLENLDNKGEFEERLKILLEVNHCLLNAIGVGHVALDTLLQTSKDYGYSGKLTGAGGGGCALVYIQNGFEESAVDILKHVLTKKGYVCYEVSLGVPGLSIHDISAADGHYQNNDNNDTGWTRFPIYRSCANE